MLLQSYNLAKDSLTSWWLEGYLGSVGLVMGKYQTLAISKTLFGYKVRVPANVVERKRK